MFSERTHEGRMVPSGLRLVAVAGATDAGLVRAINDDAFAVQEDLGLLLVADGVGGRPAGDVAASVALSAVCGYFASPDTTWPTEGQGVGRLLGAAVAMANRVVYEAGRSSPLTEGMATTLVAVIAAPEGVWVAHVGDSRAFLFRDGQLTRLTVDHTIESDAAVRTRLSAEELLKYKPDVLTRGIGLHETVAVAMRFEPVRAGDVTLLATDGLTKVVEEAEIAGLLAEASNLATAVETLIERANAGGGPDNVTVVAGRWAEGWG